MPEKKRRVAENILAKNESELAKSCRSYLQWLAVKNYSPRTITGHYYALNFFLSWCLERGLDSLAQISCQEIKMYELNLLAEQDGHRFGVHHRYRLLQVVKAMFRYLAENEILDTSPAQHIELPQLTRHIPCNVLGHKQIETILRQPDVEKSFGLRDRAILELIYSTGIRRREVVALEVDDVNLHAGVLYVREGKGRKQRFVPIGERAIEWLCKYLYEVRPLLLKTRQSNSLFLTYKGKGFSCSGLANMVVPYVRATGEKGCCHIFRHAMATSMLENGANISSIQEILGHEQLSSTQVYTHLTTGKLREVYDRTHPANVANHGIADKEGIIEKPLYKWGGQPFKKKPAKKKVETHFSGALSEQVGKYLQTMANKNMSAQTIKKREQHLKRFLSWCDQRSIQEHGQVTHALIERYHKDLYRQRYKDKPLNPAYIGRHLISIRCFFAWLSNSGIMLRNPTQKIKLPKRMKTIPHQILSQEEIEKIFAQVDTADLLGVRDRAILELLWATGIRKQELCCLSLEDVNLEQKTVRISQVTGERIIPITSNAQKWLQTYISQARPKLLRQESLKFLFIGRYGSHLSPVTLAETVKRYLKKAGIKKTGTCRIFRHTLAIAMLENGADIRHIQEILGHTNLSSTQIYTKVSIRRLKEVHSQTHPASKLKGNPDHTSTIDDNADLSL